MGQENSQHIIKTLFELGRISNILTVISNIILGCYLAGNEKISHLIYFSAGGSLLYLGGMYLNDYFDYNWDVKNNSSRPIPSGYIRRASVLVLAIIQILAGISLFIYSQDIFNLKATLSLLILVGFILWYNLDHKENTYSPLLMSLCRVTLILTSFLYVSFDVNYELIAYLITYFLYTCALTYIAKYEHTTKENFKFFFRLTLFIPYIFLIPILNESVTILAWISSLGWSVYIVRNFSFNPIGYSVTSLIAGMILLDGIFLASFGYSFYLLALFMFFSTIAFQKIIRGT